MTLKEITQPGGSFAVRTVETLEEMQDDVFDRYHAHHRPTGKTWLYMVLDLARDIVDRDGLLETITEDDLNQLTEENFHTARTAAEVAIHLNSINI